ncbi:MAG: hypothetical protein P8Y46_06015 [Sulfurovaceae bacterium]
MPIKTLLLRSIISLFVLISLAIGSLLVWQYISINKEMDIFTKRIVNKAMDRIIQYDKNARRFYMLQDGKTEVQIEKTLQKLQSKYDYEREKMWRYCNSGDERCHLHTDYHELLFPIAYIVLNYEFDTDSKEFFNQYFISRYLDNKHDPFLVKIEGIDHLKYNNLEQPFKEYGDYHIDGGIEFETIRKLHSDEVKNYYIMQEGCWK